MIPLLLGWLAALVLYGSAALICVALTWSWHSDRPAR